MSPIETAVRVVIDLLVRRDYDTVERLQRGSVMPAAALETAVSEYGRTLVPPGDGWWQTVEVTPVTASDVPEFHVAAPVWTAEEGRSDLTLELRLTEIAPEAYQVGIEGLHVL